MKYTPKIKICGLTNRGDLQAVISMGVDYVGIVTGVTSSPRNLSVGEVKQLVKRVEGVKTVLVMVPCDTDEIIDAYNRVKPDYIQVHGDMNLYEKLEGLDIPFFVGVNNKFRVEDVVDLSLKYMIVMDTYLSGMYGGTGVTHDWDRSRVFQDKICPGRLVLAGGLNPDNVAEAVKTVHPYCVDVSSGVELSPGIKDHDKLSAFIQAVRGVDPIE